MNRFKAEEARKRSEARAGQSDAEIEALDREEARNAEILELARQIHADWFPEEYDYLFDSIADSNDRARGINPMNSVYIDVVSAKRRAEGAEPLSVAGLAASSDTWDRAYTAAEAIVKRQHEQT